MCSTSEPGLSKNKEELEYRGSTGSPLREHGGMRICRENPCFRRAHLYVSPGSCLAENFKTYMKAGSNRKTQVEFNDIGSLQPGEGFRSCCQE